MLVPHGKQNAKRQCMHTCTHTCMRDSCASDLPELGLFLGAVLLRASVALEEVFHLLPQRVGALLGSVQLRTVLHTHTHTKDTKHVRAYMYAQHR